MPGSLLRTEGESQAQTHQGRNRCTGSGPLLVRIREKQALWVDGAARRWSLAEHREDRPLSAPGAPRSPCAVRTPHTASKAATSLGSDHCGQGVESSSQNRRAPGTGQETQLLPKNIPCSERAARLGPGCRSDPTPPSPVSQLQEEQRQ